MKTSKITVNPISSLSIKQEEIIERSQRPILKNMQNMESTITYYHSNSNAPYQDERQIVFGEGNANRIVSYVDDLPKRKGINIIEEVHDVERPIEKISKEEAEMEYKKKLIFLERQKRELEIMLKMPFKETRIVKVQDGVRKKQAEFKIMDLKEQIGENREEIDKLKKKLPDLEVELQILLDQVQQLEVDESDWKMNFRKINHKTSEAQEKLMMAEAELDNMKKRKILVTQTVEKTRI